MDDLSRDNGAPLVGIAIAGVSSQTSTRRAPTITVNSPDVTNPPGPQSCCAIRVTDDETHTTTSTSWSASWPRHVARLSRHESLLDPGPFSTSSLYDSSPSSPSHSSRSTHGTDISTAATSVSLDVSNTSSKSCLLDHHEPNSHGRAVHTSQSCVFDVSPDMLADLIGSKSMAELQALGGLDGITRALKTDCLSGLSLDETGVQDSTDDTPPTGADSWDGPYTLHQRRLVFGTNQLPDKKIKNVLQLMLAALNDKVLILLSIVAVVSLSLGLYQAFGQPHAPNQPRVEWIDGVTIMVAVVIVVVAGALNDYQKEQQFARLTKKKDDRLVKAIRSGKPVEVSVYNIYAGDVLYLEPGDLVPADGILISGFNIRCDESSVTGESDQVTKISGTEALARLESGQHFGHIDPFIISGSKILEGLGTYLVTGVGVNSSYGRLKMGLTERTEATPLQQKLSTVADRIAMAGVTVAILLFIVLAIKFFVQLPGRPISDFEKAQMFLRIFIVSITVVVIAVPEGLPLAVTLALAIAVTRMLKDNNLVRILSACETMGNATTICSDKTGTLTMNEMRVTAGTIGKAGRFVNQRARFLSLPSRASSDDSVARSSAGSADSVPSSSRLADAISNSSPSGMPTCRFISSLSPYTRRLLLESVAINSTVFEGEHDGKKAFIGSHTEAALLRFATERLGLISLQEERANVDRVEVFPFDSNRKCMATVIRLGANSCRMFVKGAPEILLEKSAYIISHDIAGSSTNSLVEEDPMTQKQHDSVAESIGEYASHSLRTLGLAYRDFPTWPPPMFEDSEAGLGEEGFKVLFQDLTFLGVLGIQDPLRPGVEDAVALCQHAGVFVRMVTGDNVNTATAVAAASGILTEDGVVMVGPQFRALSPGKMNQILPRLQVLARSSPDDKRLLVKRLKELGETVAVTGDGTNDGPALRAADVGFSMGISGTEITKEASSIVLMDDNFASIVKAIEWGRTVNQVIKKFLQFQLTVNLTAVILTFATAMSSDTEESILTPVQLLWVNLIMDTFAALALATDVPNPNVLNNRPERRSAPLISLTSWKMIVGQSVYQLAVTLVLNFAGRDLLGYTGPEDAVSFKTFIFNTFVWMQFFNLYNNRRIDNKLNILEDVTKNPFFIAINIVIVAGQVLIVTYGGAALSVTNLTAAEWGASLLLGFLSIPIGILIRLIPDNLIRWCMGRNPSKATAAPPAVEEVSSWNQAIDNVLVELMLLRQPRSSRLERIGHGISGFIQGKKKDSELDLDGELEGPPLSADERGPLLPQVSRARASVNDRASCRLYRSTSSGSSLSRSDRRLYRSVSSGSDGLYRPGSNSSFAPVAVMAGMVAGSVAGWPSPAGGSDIE
ncbi:hypothetical protein B0T17DRAFT_241918 [Bombardia bombarda]|uniref:Calcium-transporting ATPase n=1 Tax=Bombardia bombarda TaxID=252184 RepID=A0AA39XD09_9PEZI|nr:hypothetical protein B0T17DRAFT_241918 [Bombardia bombarda]